MTPNSREIAIGSQEFEVVTNCKLSQQCINSRYLNPSPPADCLYRRGFDMVGKIGDDQGQTEKTFDQAFALLGAPESLQKFLNNNSCCVNCVVPFKTSRKDSYFLDIRRRITAKG